MYPVICKLPGPFAIHSYGLTIALGSLLFYWLAQRKLTANRLLSADTFASLLVQGIIVGIISGKLFYFLTEPDAYQSFKDLLYIWQGGFSILGTVIGIALYVMSWLWYHKKPFLRMLDIFALYAPLIHLFGRIGCLLSGCCYGIATNLPWAIVYPEQSKLLVHPTQLYSALSFLVIFILLWLIHRHHPRPGIITCLYLLLSGFERFANDFLRFYRTMQTFLGITLSISQWAAVGIMAIACLFLMFLVLRHQK